MCYSVAGRAGDARRAGRAGRARGDTLCNTLVAGGVGGDGGVGSLETWDQFRAFEISTVLQFSHTHIVKPNAKSASEGICT